MISFIKTDTLIFFLPFFSVSQHMLSEVTTLPGVQLGDFLLQFELEEPRESVREIARRELRESPEIVKPAVEELRRLLEGTNSLKFL